MHINKLRKINFIIVILIFNTTLIIPQVQQEKQARDVIVLLDRSNSMNNVFPDIKEYMTNELLKQVNVGDNMFIIPFYGKTEIAYNKNIKTTDELKNVENIINSLQADGPYTDIGNALDVLLAEVKKNAQLNNRKHVLLLSDGYQEAVPGSKYYSEDMTINHKLLENARTIDRMGWKIQIISIGDQPEMKKVAEEIGATYKKTSEQPDAQEMAKTIDVMESATLSCTVKSDLGSLNEVKGKIKAEIESTYQENIAIKIRQIILENIIGMSPNLKSKTVPAMTALNTEPIIIEVKANETQTIKIPVKTEQSLPPGKYSGRIKFYFDSDQHFSPTNFVVDFNSPALWQTYIIWIILVLLLLAAILIWMITSQGENIVLNTQILLGLKKVIKMKLLDKKPFRMKTIVLNKNEKKGLGGGKSKIKIPKGGFVENIAEIYFDKEGLHFNTIKPEYIDVKVPETDFLNKEIPLKSITRSELKVEFNLPQKK